MGMKFENIKEDKWYYIRFKPDFTGRDVAEIVLVKQAYTEKDIIVLLWDEERFKRDGTAMQHIVTSSSFMGIVEDPRKELKERKKNKKKEKEPTIIESLYNNIRDFFNNIDFT